MTEQSERSEAPIPFDDLEPEEKKKLMEEFIHLRDEQTVFALAGLALDLHVAVLTKNKANIANSYMKINVVLTNNPGFVKRFKAAQHDVIEQIKKAANGSQVKEALIANTVPPTVTRLTGELGNDTGRSDGSQEQNT